MDFGIILDALKDWESLFLTWPRNVFVTVLLLRLMEGTSESDPSKWPGL